MMRILALILALVVITGCGPNGEQPANDQPQAEPGKSAEGSAETLVRGEVSSAEADMKTLSAALQFYYVSHSRYPDSLERLVQPDPENGYPSGYLKQTDRIPRDPWDEEYGYTGRGRSFVLHSNGPDRVDGTEDDLRIER